MFSTELAEVGRDEEFVKWSLFGIIEVSRGAEISKKIQR